jgi:hypothetical protein
MRLFKPLHLYESECWLVQNWSVGTAHNCSYAITSCLNLLSSVCQYYLQPQEQLKSMCNHKLSVGRTSQRYLPSRDGQSPQTL